SDRHRFHYPHRREDSEKPPPHLLARGLFDHVRAERHGDRAHGVRSFDGQRDGLVRPDRNDVGDVVEGRSAVPGDVEDPIARLEPPGRRAIADHRSDRIGLRGADEREESCENGDREDEIGQGTGQHNQKSLPYRAKLECFVAKLRWDLLEIRGIARGAHVADELHVAAERQPGDLPAGPLLVCPTSELMAEADRKGFRRDAEQTGHEVMAELVEEDERPERADEGDEHEPERRLREHQWQLSLINASAWDRVVRSISNTSSIVRGAGASPRWSASSTSAAISAKPSRPARKPATATSLAALSTTGAAPPASNAW